MKAELKRFVRLIREHEACIANGDEPDPASELAQDCISALIDVGRSVGITLTMDDVVAILEG